MNEITNIENALESSAAKDNLLDIIGGAADYSIEHLLSISDNIPIVSYFTKGFKATLAVRDFLFMEKVIEFLRQVGQEPTPSRQKMIEKIHEDAEYTQKFGKVSLVAIERFDDIGKATLLGYAAKYLAREEITFSLYKRIAFIIGRVYLSDIITFANHNKRLVLLNSTPDLEALSLVKTTYGMAKNYDGDEMDIGSSTSITDLGKLIKCIVLQIPLNTQIPSGVNVKETFEERMKIKYP